MIITTTQIRRHNQPAVVTCKLEVSSIGSGLSQCYDAISEEYFPDRTLSPLVIAATVKAFATDGTLGNESQAEDITSRCTFQWLMRENYSDNDWIDVSSLGSGWLASNNKLSVLHNRRGSIFLKAIVRYNDSRMGYTVQVESETLTIETSMQTTDELRLVLNGNTRVSFNPFLNPRQVMYAGKSEAFPASHIQVINVNFAKGSVVGGTVPRNTHVYFRKKNGDPIKVGDSVVFDFADMAAKELAMFTGDEERSIIEGKTYIEWDDFLKIDANASSYHLSKSYGGLLADVSGTRNIVVRRVNGHPIVRVTYNKGTTSVNGTENLYTGGLPKTVKRLSDSRVELTIGDWFSVSSDGNGDILLAIPRYICIEKIEIIGITGMDIFASFGHRGSKYGIVTKGQKIRNTLQKYDVTGGNPKIFLDCGAAFEFACDVVLANEDNTTIYDVRDISVLRAFPVPEAKVISTDFADDKHTTAAYECHVFCNQMEVLSPLDYFDIKWYGVSSLNPDSQPTVLLGSGNKMTKRNINTNGGYMFIVGVEVSVKESVDEYVFGDNMPTKAPDVTVNAN